LHSIQEYTDDYLVNLFTKYLFLSTFILVILFIKYIHVNPVLLFPIVLNVVIFYIVKYNAPIKIMIHIFIIVLLLSILGSSFYVTHNSFLVFLILLSMFPYLTLSLVKLDIAIVYNVILPSSIFVINQYLGFLKIIDNKILLVFYFIIIISSLFFAISRIFQVRNIENISSYLDGEIKRRDDKIENLDGDILKLLEKIDSLKIKDDITGFYEKSITIEFLHNEVIKSIRLNNHLLVACIHIKNYRAIEQLYGRETLQQAFKQISIALRVAIRRTDVIGHFDKETLICIISHTSFDNFSILADKILTEINKIVIEKFSIDISMGVSSIDGNNYDIQTVVNEEEYNIVSQMLSMARQSVNIADRENKALHHFAVKETN